MHDVDHKENVIEVRGVSFAYGERQILEDITLAVHRGDYLGMVGPNGAGKTTLLKIMLGLLTPARGSVRLFGEDIKRFRDFHKIGYVPQKATNFDPQFPATVEEVVLMGRIGLRGLGRGMTAEDTAQALAALKNANLAGFERRLIGSLSGGEQQRVMIARALASKPEVIFLDEPVTGVDAASQDEFYALVRTLNKEMDLTLVLVSHDIERVVKEAMHIACIDRHLVCHSSPEEFLKDAASARIAGSEVKVLEHHHA